jgi:glycosyltransferase involved in cell wall biosynthesis
VGGADKLEIEHMNALLLTNYKPCLITTIKAGERINQIPVPWFDIISNCPEWNILADAERHHILMKAIINSRIKIVHIIQSNVAMQLVDYYSDVFKEYSIRVMISYYCPDYDWVNKKYSGYPVMYPDTLYKADIILSDNNYWFDYFKSLAGRDFKYKKLFSPIGDNPKEKIKATNNKKILWASRICNQKLIGVLLGICKSRPDITFVIYGNKFEDILANKYFDEILKLKNVDYRGVYNNYSEIDMNEFDLLLFTSKFEGISFIRLDLINHNVPIISSDVGDSLEIFGDHYELLVKDLENSNEYLEKIDLFYKDPSFFFEKTKKMKEQIRKNHNLESFQKQYIEVLKDLEK